MELSFSIGNEVRGVKTASFDANNLSSVILILKMVQCVYNVIIRDSVDLKYNF